MGADRLIRASAVAGILASALWVVALIVEYQFALRPPGDGSDLYKADQAAFLLAEAGYLAMLIGLYRAHPGGHRWFGRAAIGLWIMGIAAILLALILGLDGMASVHAGHMDCLLLVLGRLSDRSHSRPYDPSGCA